MTEYQTAPAATAVATEFQAVTLKLTRRPHDDDDALTDMLNERSRTGWTPAMMAQGEGRLTVIFRRTAPAG
ncbi:MAG: hypothetical protein M3154_09770 [Candidatus Eremiobacteraeota bacterium]|nr:hypothetical protein [Candidatus Eremiobacteraeota bacterium]